MRFLVGHKGVKFSIWKFAVFGENIKTYFIPRYFVTTWTNTRSICKAYGMDVLSLDTEDEETHLLGLLESNSRLFTQWTYVGALTLVGGSRDNWYWVNSGNRVNYPITFGVDEPNFGNSNEFCLAVGKYSASEFYFNDMPCHEETQYKFFCQLQKEEIREETTASGREETTASDDTTF